MFMLALSKVVFTEIFIKFVSIKRQYNQSMTGVLIDVTNQVRVVAKTQFILSSYVVEVQLAGMSPRP